MNPTQHGEVFVTDDGAETDLDLGHYERFISHADDEAQQRDHRPDLRDGHPEGAPRRVPRRHRAGHPARHRRDQGAHPRLRRGRGRPHRRDRRHRRRHRVAAVPRGDPSAAARGRPHERDLRARHARAVHRRRGRAQDEADAALGQEDARDRHPARHPALPLARGPSRRRSRRRSRSSPTSPSTASSRPRTSRCIYEVPAPLPRRGRRRQDRRAAQHLVARARAHGLAARRPPAQEPARPRSRSASSASTSTSTTRTRPSTRRSSTAASATTAASTSTTSTPRRSRSAAPTPCSPAIDGILVAPGFGGRGTEGKIEAIRYAREQGVPFFGICLGMQMAVIEFARNVAGLEGANSTEFDRQGAVPGHRPHARAAQRHREGRDDAPRRLSLRADARARRPRRPTARPRSASATATATRSTTTTARP